jgi:tryptophan 2,3-dioxygenase
MMSAFFRGVSSESAGARRSSRHAVRALETWPSWASAHEAQRLVIAHQAHELWFNQLLCELTVLVADLDADSLPAASRTLQRAARITGVLAEQTQELGALHGAGRHLGMPFGGSLEAERELSRRLELLVGTRAAGIGRWIARDRPRSTSVREAFLRAVARQPSAEAEAGLSRAPALAELQAWLAQRLAHPACAAQHELAVGLRALDERLVHWARQRRALCARPREPEGRLRTPGRFFPELWR